MADDPEHVRLPGRAAHRSEAAHHAVHVARAAREIVGVVERLHAHDVPAPAERAGEGLARGASRPNAGATFSEGAATVSAMRNVPAGSGSAARISAGPCAST